MQSNILRTANSLVVITFFASASPLMADVRIGTWNLKNLGWDNDKDIATVAEIANSFDLVAVQEIMSEEAAAHLHQELEQISDSSWGYMVSRLIGRGSYQEAYGYFYREDAITYEDGAVVFLDSSDVFAREPFSARFRTLEDDNIYAIGNIHVLYGDGVSDRLPEIDALSDYWQWMGEIYPETPRILLGDFNLDSRHPAFQELYAQGATAAVRDGDGTTISSINGRYANHYDHIMVEEGAFSYDSGVFRFPAVLGMPHEQARKTISDHVPVWVSIHTATDATVTDRRSPRAPQPQVRQYRGTTAVDAGATKGSDDCIDLNQSSAEQLVKLPHIGVARSQDIIGGRPWNNTSALTAVKGLGNSRVADIANSELLCDA